ncbi:hypothetical protein EOM33_00260 [Candidatus Saccharibacteria bacterium]|nr:hypothetical protein [Candidatus Saccharibacteria bacterium]
MRNMQRVHEGFTLPTVVVASVAMLAMLLMSFQLSAASSNALRAQYYQQLSNTAAEAGVARATECIEKNNGVAGWSVANKQLTASTDCSGDTRPECIATPTLSSCYVAYVDAIQSNYSIGTVTTSGTGYSISAVGVVNQVNSSGGVVSQAASGSASYMSTTSNVPKITGGAGWLDYGHIGMFISVKGQLYGYGEDGDGQITSNPISPYNIAKPTQIPLPTGVSTVKVAKTSGQGASFICIIGNNDQAYCRGNGLGLDNTGWQQIRVPSGWNVYDMTLNGYGEDSVCVLTSTAVTVLAKRVRCAGSTDFGRLGNGSANAGNVALSGSVLFGSGMSQDIEKLYETTGNMTCAKSSTNSKLYCAGGSWYGQLGLYQESVDSPVDWGMPSMGEVTRVPLDVVSDYHSDEATHVLATDGTIWSRGNRAKNANFGSGASTGETGASVFPDWFGPRGGSITHSSGKCVDVDEGDNSEGTKVQLWSCDGLPTAQRFFITNDTGDGSAIFYPTSTNNTTNMCLDLAMDNITKNLQLWSCQNNNTAQRWLLGADGRIRYKGNTNYCIYPTSTANGASLKLQLCSSSTGQVFTASEDAKPYKAMISGNNFFCGIKENSARCGGRNNYGQLMNYLSTTQKDGNQYQSTANTWQITLPAGEAIDFEKLANGSGEWKYQYNSLQVITKSGKVYGAGVNGYGKLGNGTTSSAQGSVVQMNLPAGVKALDMSTRDEYTTYVLGDNGNIYATGWNDSGQLGIGSMSPTFTSNPLRVLLNREGYLF